MEIGIGIRMEMGIGTNPNPNTNTNTNRLSAAARSAAAERRQMLKNIALFKRNPYDLKYRIYSHSIKDHCLIYFCYGISPLIHEQDGSINGLRLKP